jgi:hypothetical protein
LKKIFFIVTSRPASIELGTNHSWVKEILNCSKNVQVFFKGEIITKMGLGHLKIFFSRTSEPEKLICT